MNTLGIVGLIIGIIALAIAIWALVRGFMLKTNDIEDFDKDVRELVAKEARVTGQANLPVIDDVATGQVVSTISFPTVS